MSLLEIEAPSRLPSNPLKHVAFFPCKIPNLPKTIGAAQIAAIIFFSLLHDNIALVKKLEFCKFTAPGIPPGRIIASISEIFISLSSSSAKILIPLALSISFFPIPIVFTSHSALLSMSTATTASIGSNPSAKNTQIIIISSLKMLIQNYPNKRCIIKFR